MGQHERWPRGVPEYSMLAEATMHCLTWHGVVAFRDPAAALRALHEHLRDHPDAAAAAWELLDLPDWAVETVGGPVWKVAAQRRAQHCVPV